MLLEISKNKQKLFITTSNFSFFSFFHTRKKEKNEVQLPVCTNIRTYEC